MVRVLFALRERSGRRGGIAFLYLRKTTANPEENLRTQDLQHFYFAKTNQLSPGRVVQSAEHPRPLSRNQSALFIAHSSQTPHTANTTEQWPPSRESAWPTRRPAATSPSAATCPSRPRAPRKSTPSDRGC